MTRDCPTFVVEELSSGWLWSNLYHLCKTLTRCCVFTDAFIFTGGHRYPQCTRLRVIVVKATADCTKLTTPSRLYQVMK